MRCAEQRASAVKIALAEYPRVAEMSEQELCRLHGRFMRGLSGNKSLSLTELVAKAQHRSRARRSR